MSTDTRPSVTVAGTMCDDSYGMWFITLDGDHPFEDGDEVEVTIRKHGRVPANPWPAPRQTEGE